MSSHKQLAKRIIKACEQIDWLVWLYHVKPRDIEEKDFFTFLAKERNAIERHAKKL